MLLKEIQEDNKNRYSYCYLEHNQFSSNFFFLPSDFDLFYDSQNLYQIQIISISSCDAVFEEKINIHDFVVVNIK